MYSLVFLYAQRMLKLFVFIDWVHKMDVWCGYLSFSTRNGWFVVELRVRGTRVCCLCGSLWLIIVTKYKDTYTLIICIPMFWNNYQYHLLGSSRPRNVGIYQSVLHYMPEEWRSHLQCSRILKSWITVTVVIFQSWNLCSYQKE